ncbi:MAG: TerB family tellurite resistance protein [Bacteroidota bacterium]
MSTLNKSTAGYKMLMILAIADGTHLGSEKKQIINFLGDYFDPEFLEAAIHSEQIRLESLHKDDLMLEFRDAMNQFYRQSTPEERTRFLQQAVDLVTADEQVSPEENLFLNRLFELWAETE